MVHINENYLKLPGSYLFRVPDDLPTEIAVLTEVMAVTAGLDKAKGELVLKAVNATPNAVKAQVSLAGAAPAGAGRKIVFASASEKDENDIAAPTKITPKEEPFTVPGAQFETELAPWSMTVIRVPVK